MADGVFNIAKGRVNELHDRVVNNDPANSALVVVILKATGLEADATLRDYDTLADILAAANDEATNVNYARKVLTNTELAASAVDDVNDRREADFPDQTYTAVAAAGGAWGKALVCYDSDTTAGTDANIVPLTYQDFAVTPDGTDILLQVAAAGYFRAS